MSRSIRLLLLIVISINILGINAARAADHTIAVLGLGGRSQFMLLECLQCRQNIRVVAVCDDHGNESLNWFARNTLQRRATPSLVQAYAKIFERASLYPDTEDGIKKMFKDNPQIDTVFITSSNDKHFQHLNAVLAYSDCKNIYIEKPLFRTLDEFQRFSAAAHKDVTISVGLTLRYAQMTKIITDTLQEHREQLGALQKMKSWERLSFGHGLTIIMMNWRRFISQSGGLLLEKSIHDLDLGLFFMRAAGFEPQEIVINTQAEHRLFKKSQKKKLLRTVAEDRDLQESLVRWIGIPFQRVVPFIADKDGYLDIAGTIEKVFEDFPDNDNFKKSDIIPDHQVLSASCKNASGASVDFELEVDMSGLRTKAERGIRFEFERGTVVVDIMESIMTVTTHDGTMRTIDLQTNNSMHAGGDAYIAQLLLGVLPDRHYRATFNDETVQLATFMGLICEQQAIGKRKQGARIKKGSNNKWSL